MFWFLLLLVSPAHAKCAESATYEVVGAVDRGIEDLCVFVGDTGRCIASEGGPFSVTLEVPVVPNGRLLVDRCTLDTRRVTLVSLSADGARLEHHRVRRRDLHRDTSPPQIDLHPRK